MSNAKKSEVFSSKENEQNLNASVDANLLKLDNDDIEYIKERYLLSNY